MGRRKPKTVENVTIIDVADRGKAIGKDEAGEVYIVDKSVPGDIVDIVFTKKRKGVKQGKIKAYRHLSDKRIEPKCEYFGQCGGCKWQNMGYEDQLFFKEKQVRDALTRIAKVDSSEVKPIKACTKQFHYRNKLEFSFSSQRWLTEEELKSDIDFGERTALGFHAPGSYNKVVDVHNCYLQDTRSDLIRNFIRDYAREHNLSYFNHKDHSGFLRTLIIRNTSIDEWMVILTMFHEDVTAREALLETLKEKFSFITSLNYVINEKRNDTILDQEVINYKSETAIREKLGEVMYSIGPKSFFQTNSEQTVVLYDVVKDFAEIDKEDIVYDLYTGIGSIALYLSAMCAEVIGIEEVDAAIEDAKANAKLNDVSNCHFYAGDVRVLLNQDLILKHGRADVLITDPPRAGMHKDVITTILNFQPKKIVYVSCNAATQARDISLLSQKYQHIKSQPVDMFPHSHHIENVALLTLRS